MDMRMIGLIVAALIGLGAVVGVAVLAATGNGSVTAHATLLGFAATAIEEVLRRTFDAAPAPAVVPVPAAPPVAPAPPVQGV